MTVPLPTLRRKTGEVIEREELSYRQARDRHAQAPRILHLADGSTNHERSLCGRKRELPLEPNAKGDMCMVCADIYWRKHGCNWNES